MNYQNDVFFIQKNCLRKEKIALKSTACGNLVEEVGAQGMYNSRWLISLGVSGAM